MGKASSAKKVARLAERGKGKKIRFQGGTAFPLTIAIVVVLGMLLIVYSRNTSRSDASGPQLQDHWHLAYGIYICDQYINPFPSNKESDPEYASLQIHSHGDGVMHWHPANELAINRTTGRKAKFKVFLNLYGVELTDSKLKLTGSELDPPGPDQVYEEGKTKCTVDGKEKNATLRVVVWDRYDKPNDYTVRTSSLGEERILKDQEVFVVAWVPEDFDNKDFTLPPWASDLPSLAAADTPGATTVPPTTVAGATTVPSSTVAGATTVPTATTVAGATTAAPSTTAVPALTTAAPSTSG